MFFYFKKNKTIVDTDGIFLNPPLPHFPFPRGATQECPAEGVGGLNPAMYAGGGAACASEVVHFKNLYKETAVANKSPATAFSPRLPALRKLSFSIHIALFSLYISIINILLFYIFKFVH